MPIIPRDKDFFASAVTSNSALYVGNNGNDGLQVTGKIRITGMEEDIQTAIEKLQVRLDKLERFYTQVVTDAQAVVDVAEYALNEDEWKERVFRIAEEVGLKETTVTSIEVDDAKQDK